MERAQGAVQLPRSVFARLPVEETKPKHVPVALRQSVEFVLKDRPALSGGDFRKGLRRGRRCRLRLAAPSSGFFAPGPRGDSVGDAAKPAADEFAASDGRGLAHENQKRGLKRVFREVGLLQDTPTDAKDGGAMSLKQGLEGYLVFLRDVAIDEFGIGQAALGQRGHQLTKVRQYGLVDGKCHSGCSSPAQLIPTYTAPGSRILPLFCVGCGGVAAFPRTRAAGGGADLLFRIHVSEPGCSGSSRRDRSFSTIFSLPRARSVSMLRRGIARSSSGSPATSETLSSRSRCSIG